MLKREQMLEIACLPGQQKLAIGGESGWHEGHERQADRPRRAENLNVFSYFKIDVTITIQMMIAWSRSRSRLMHD
jgi:hypothetical protein